MKAGAREFDPRHLLETPEVFAGKLFILGGIIVDAKLVEQGSQIEALLVPVDRYGYLKEDAGYHGRFIALVPRSRGILDPMIYKKGREITVAGDFVEVRKGKIDEMEVRYPVFEVREVHLWEEFRGYPYYYAWPPSYSPYYTPYYSPYLYDPWWRPYPGYGWPYPRW